MQLCMGIMVEDLAFHFNVSTEEVSEIFITWIKLMSRERIVLVIWQSSSHIKSTFPNCFKNLYHSVRVIIDCRKVFMETPSSFVVQACLYKDYKHHCTIKFLVELHLMGHYRGFPQSMVAKLLMFLLFEILGF